MSEPPGAQQPRASRRGQGNVADVLSRRARSRGGTGEVRQVVPSDPTPAAPQSGKQKTGKSSDPEYKGALAYIKKTVHEQAMEALANREVKRKLQLELAERGVRFQPGKPNYSDLSELLLLEWFERVGRKPDDAAR